MTGFRTFIHWFKVLKRIFIGLFVEEGDLRRRDRVRRTTGGREAISRVASRDARRNASAAPSDELHFTHALLRHPRPGLCLVAAHIRRTHSTADTVAHKTIEELPPLRIRLKSLATHVTGTLHHFATSKGWQHSTHETHTAAAAIHPAVAFPCCALSLFPEPTSTSPRQTTALPQHSSRPGGSQKTYVCVALRHTMHRPRPARSPLP